MADPDDDRRARERSIRRMSLIAFILAFLVMLLGILYNRPTVAPSGSIGESTRSV
jgi:hypothetical protein